MILNILISLGITIGFLAILGALSLIIIYVVTNIDAFIERKKEEIGLKRWHEIDTIIRMSIFIVCIISLLTFMVYVTIFT